MNLTDEQIVSVDQVNLTDALNGALLELEVSRNANTIAPDTNELIVYVDTNSSDNPTDKRKQYVFDLSKKLEYFNEVSDEFLLEFKILDNDVSMQALVKRKVEIVDGVSSIAEVIEVEKLEAYPIVLFEGENYIYTNYSNASISLTYPKDNEFNKMYLNNAVYFEHKENNKTDFSLDDIYFKDAFTKKEDNLNICVNEVSFDSFTSNNNNFSLDSEGNLIVNSVTTNQNLINTSDICDLIYPVGSIYMSINSTSPATLFGGTWEQIQDTFLLASGTTYESGLTGGTTNHKHIAADMRAKIGAQYGLANTINYVAVDAIDPNTGLIDPCGAYSVKGASYSNQQPFSHWTSVVGYTDTVDNMPPYLAVNIWKRTS